MTAVELLAEWILRSSILIAGGALLQWLSKVLLKVDSSIRAAAWTSMLCGSLAMPALIAGFPETFIPTVRPTAAGVVILPAAVPVAISESTPANAHTPVSRIQPTDTNSGLAARTPKPGPPVTRAIDWERAGLILYPAISGAMLLRICVGLFIGLRLLRRSRSTGKATGEVAIRESSAVAAPVTLGLFHPAIVLPADWREWDSRKLEAVLAHERSHIQRRDPWVQLLSSIHRALLWASPFSWLLHRRIVQTAEEASDDAAVAAIRDPAFYAETLLDFMQRGVLTSGFVGVSMARYGSPEKRIRRILNSTSFSRAVTTRSVAAIVAVVSPLAYVIATAQTRPQFDIADVHVSALSKGANPNVRGGVMRAGIFQIQTATMVDLIKTAYSIDADKVLGGPSWLELERYDVFAKAPASAKPDSAPLMLQSLLAERFKLALHKESRPLPGFALRIGKAGKPQLKKSAGTGGTGCRWTPQNTEAELGARRQAAIQAGENPAIVQTYLYACQNMTMPAFAEGMRSMPNAQQYFDTGAVVDQTGLSGEWDFNFRYTPKLSPSDVARAVDGEYITLFDAIEKQLGLKLETARIPTPVIVVDSVNRKPIENPPEVKAILPPPPPAAFEVADLKLSAPDAPEVRSPGPQPGGRFEVRNFPLALLITLGWEVSMSELKGAPPWLNSVRVDLTAKLPSTEATREVVGVADAGAFQPALRALLTERFKIAIHTEQQLVPGYALVAVKPKLTKANPTTRTKCKEGPGADGKDPRIGNPLLSRLVTCLNMTMPEFVEQLPRLLGGPVRTEVVDVTGIEGAYDFTLSFSPAAVTAAQPPPANGQGPALDPGGGLTLFAALEKQLGLKLEKRNILMPVVVLDHIEEKPAGN